MCLHFIHAQTTYVLAKYITHFGQQECVIEHEITQVSVKIYNNPYYYALVPAKVHILPHKVIAVSSAMNNTC